MNDEEKARELDKKEITELFAACNEVADGKSLFAIATVGSMLILEAMSRGMPNSTMGKVRKEAKLFLEHVAKHVSKKQTPPPSWLA